jgi:hypothetical protein
MTRPINSLTTPDEWPVPAFWRSEGPADGPICALPRPGLAARLVAAVLDANARFRNAQRMERMCDRMRADIGLPLKGEEVRKLELRIEELQRWS